MQWTEQRNIIVQIEVWDRFDHSQEHWEADPYRPAHNVNFTTDSSGLTNHYPAPAWRDRQPFFHTIPGMPLYEKRLDVVRKYQERFVLKMLSYSLSHRHVLYCMNNETSTSQQWGRHWIALIEREAAKAGVPVFCTDMFNDGYEPERSQLFAQAWDAENVYRFLDISQINSRLFNEIDEGDLRFVVVLLPQLPGTVELRRGQVNQLASAFVRRLQKRLDECLGLAGHLRCDTNELSVR